MAAAAMVHRYACGNVNCIASPPSSASKSRSITCRHRVIAQGDFVAPPLSWDADFGVCGRICTARRLSVRGNSPLAFQVRFPCLPPGTSQWNKIEHHLFSYISQN